MRFFVFIYILIIPVLARAQKLTNKPLSKELKVGDKIPDIYVGEIVANVQKKYKFSDYKGKLLILDFFTTACQSCIENFPHLEQLQKEFGDKIQVLLVNTTESPKEIKEKIGYKYEGGTKEFKLSILPVFSNKNLFQYLPRPYAGGTVWIDQKGVIRLIGNSFNTHEKKIREFLAGKPIKSYMANAKISDEPIILDKDFGLKSLQFSNIFTKYENHYADQYWEDVIDSANSIFRNTYLNQSVVELYNHALKGELKKLWQNEIKITGHDLWRSWNYLLVEDTLIYTDNFLPPFTRTDENYMQNKFCYEQVMPLMSTKLIRKRCMLDDLNKFFGLILGTQGKIEKVKVPCYLLVRTSDTDKLRTKGGTKGWVLSKENGVDVLQYTNYDLKMAVSNVIYSVFKSEKHPIFLDETGYLEKVDIALPKNIRSLAELKSILSRYNLDVIKAERELDMLVIRDKQYLSSSK